MKQIVDKLNKIAKKIDESVEIPQTDLIIDSLDAITKAYGGTPNDSNLIVDKLEDIYNNIGSGVSGNIEITENGENINVAPYATATVNVSGGSGINLRAVNIKFVNYSGSDLILSELIYAKTVSGDRYSLATLPTIADDTVSNMIAYTFVEEEDYYVQFTPNVNVVVTISENVNCTGTVDPDFNNSVSIYVTDPTQGASITVRFDAA